MDKQLSTKHWDRITTELLMQQTKRKQIAIFTKNVLF